MLKVSELFFSIQGESTFAGLPCVFIRLHGCNLRCHYCDARYTYEESGAEKSLDEIINFVDQYPGALVEITGGEPLLQPACVDLATVLIKSGRTVLIETNGSLDISHLPSGVIKIIDLKCPDSGMCQQVAWDNLDKLGPLDEVKFVLSSRTDYDWALETINKYTSLSTRASGRVLFSPVLGLLDPAQLVEWMLKDQPPARLQLQLHKQLWPDCNRGV
nr:radical SAM protein [Desulfobulbaceae bacterium]